MGLFDIFRVGQIKRELAVVSEERDRLRSVLSETDRMTYLELKESIDALQEREGEARTALDDATYAAQQAREESQKEIDELAQQESLKRAELVVLDEEILLQSFGLYEPRYSFKNSDAYRKQLERIRDRQKAMVKAGTAVISPNNWTLNGSQAEGNRMIRDYTKLIVRSFNNECDASIIKIKFNNVASVEKKIRKAQETLNKLASRMGISIVAEYLELKLDELHLAYEYEVEKQREKEEQKRLREEMREEARLQKEIEELKSKIDKEERHFAKALQILARQGESATTDAERVVVEEERQLILAKLDELGHAKEDVLQREQNTRAGYVYIISNVGSFGEGIFKIGVTRRFDPIERVDELGDASVPFRFDIHATIFSDDAPALENALHKALAEKRMNRINLRREFFRSSLEEIEDLIRTNFRKPVEFVRLAEASEFRQSLALLRPVSSLQSAAATTS